MVVQSELCLHYTGNVALLTKRFLFQLPPHRLCKPEKYNITMKLMGPLSSRIHSHAGLTLETSVLKSFMVDNLVDNLPYQPCG